MTLFRKVFQNQSRPAREDEVLDEEAIRAAFMEMDAESDTLYLEPFEQASGDEQPFSLPAFDDVTAKDENQQVDAPEEAALAEPLSETCAAEGTDRQSPEYEEHADPVRTPVAPAAVQSDEEIAACLDRAMATGPAAPSEAEKEEADMEEAGTLTQPDPLFETMTQAQSAEVEIENDGVETPAPVPVDVKAFALEQLEAMEAAHVRPPQEEASNDQADQSPNVALSAVPAPAAGRAGRRAGRVKTRLLGFTRGEEDADPFGRTPDATATAQREKFPVGWLVIVEGPGVGHSFSIFSGASMIGRGEDQVIRLDFGDTSISRHNHAAIAYDEEDNKFYLGHGGKSNIIRRNARPVLSTEELHHADLIRIGETTLRFVALCGSDFRWNGVERSEAASA